MDILSQVNYFWTKSSLGKFIIVKLKAVETESLLLFCWSLLSYISSSIKWYFINKFDHHLKERHIFVFHSYVLKISSNFKMKTENYIINYSYSTFVYLCGKVIRINPHCYNFVISVSGQGIEIYIYVLTLLIKRWIVR